MKIKPTLLFYCQHSLGMGHLVRALTLTESLAQQFKVIFLNGGRFPDHAVITAGVEIVNLPPLGMDESNQLYSQDSRYSLLEAQALRKLQIMVAMRQFQPHVILIELFPFGRKKFAGELLPLLKVAKRQVNKPLVLCSLRDIMVNARKDQVRHDNRARWLIDRYFDGILVHSDPHFASLDQSFKPSRPLAKPVHYTGFVLPKSRAQQNSPDKQGILVSVGGGMVGAPLLNIAAQAQPKLWAELKLPMTIVAGPFLPETDWLVLQAIASNRPGLTLHRHVSDMAKLLAEHALSVSQCGYNTVMDILKSGISALVVPFAQGQEDEQTNRAQKLCALGLLRHAAAEDIDVARFILEVKQTLAFKPDTSALDMAGTEKTTAIIQRMLALKNSELTALNLPELEKSLCLAG